MFDIAFYPFPHLKYMESKFDAAAVEFRQRFVSESNPYYYFKNFDSKANLPIDGLSEYMSRLWTQIRSNKELNLPSQKIMVSNFRCSEIKREAMALVEGKLNDFLEKSKTQLIEKIGEEFTEIKSVVLSYYEKNAGDYQPEVVLDKRDDLIRELNTNLDKIRKNNIARAEKTKTLLDEFNGKINIVKREKDLRTAMRACRDLCSGFVSRYECFLKQCIFTSSSEEDQRSVKNFESLIDGKLTDFINSRINVFGKSLQTTKQKEMDAKFAYIFTELSPAFWEDIKTFYNGTLAEVLMEFKQFREEFPEIEKIITEEYIIQVQYEFHTMIESGLRQKCTSLSKFILEKFRKLFERDRGIRRNWKNIQEGDIVNIWTEAKETCILIFEHFMEKGLPKFKSEIDTEWDPANGSPIISKKDLVKCRSRFEDNANDELDKVYAKKNNQGGLDKVPKWLWIILLYFMHDNILEWMRSPIIFGILLVTVGTIVYLVTTGQLGKVTMMFWQVYGLLRSLLASKGVNLPAFETAEEPKNFELSRSATFGGRASVIPQQAVNRASSLYETDGTQSLRNSLIPNH